MSEKLQIPREAAKFILLQRCDLQKFGKKIHHSKIADLAYGFYEKSPILRKIYKAYSALGLEPLLRYSEISRGYSSMMQEELQIFRPYLPGKAENILDIGCGIAGLDAQLFHYYGTKPHLYLVDKSEVSEEIFYGYHPQAASYNSLSLARKLLELNNVHAACIHTIEASEFESTNIPKVDLAFSTIAWGFHFPVEVYIARVFDLLKDDASLILDIRKETDGIDVLKKYFEECTIIQDRNRPPCVRVLARKKRSGLGKNFNLVSSTQMKSV